MANYKDTLNLPKTKFPMKANLPQREPSILEKWQDLEIYNLLRKTSKGKKKYVLHDGPPYANGDIHIGHALNKTLKDIVVKYKSMRGFDAPYVPGWDCHGLPVEHQLFKELGITKHEIDQLKFRKKAHKYALKYVEIQKEQFKRLGVFGEWDDPYITLNSRYEKAIVSCLGRLAKKGFIYRAPKPINWCIKCETALAEAEVEYADHTSPSVYVKFKHSDDTYFVIWTTTPWTLISNVAIAVHPEFKYAFVKANEQILIIAEDLVAPTMETAGIENYKLTKTVKGTELEGLECQHPFIDRKSGVVLANYVSNIEGTGCVHTAPGHGQEDYQTGLKYNLPVIMPVDSKGKFDKSTGDFENVEVFAANDMVIEKLKEGHALLASAALLHSYPHCWRCKNPVITRATQQWFINVDHKDLRKNSLKQIDSVKWVPAVGQKRISSMVNSRPDWCLSRQRYWGVPIPAFYCNECNEVLLDAKTIEAFSKIVEKEGTDAWFSYDSHQLLPKNTKCKKCNSTSFRKESDILDVWFDSGVSHQAVLVPRKDQQFPADLYLEGSDQHRGWFQTALLTGVSLVGKAPFRQVLTHGFVVDGDGRKMSKSLGNVVSPQDVISKSGADVLRLWVSSCDYNGDVRVSGQILERVAEAYRKLRNTFKFLLGNLYDFDPKKDSIAHDQLLEIDKWAMAKLYKLLEDVTNYYEAFEFYKIYREVYNFCTVDMSSFYLDILKDRVYTFAADSTERRSAQTVLYEILSCLVRITAPVLAFTCEEVWDNMVKDENVESIHVASWPKSNKNWKDEALLEKWDRLMQIRPIVLKALEERRGDGLIGNSLQAEIKLFINQQELYSLLKEYSDQLNAIFIVSGTDMTMTDILPEDVDGISSELGMAVKIMKASGEKCQRCWNYSNSVGEDKERPDICKRCIEAIGG